MNAEAATHEGRPQPEGTNYPIPAGRPPKTKVDIDDLHRRLGHLAEFMADEFGVQLGRKRGARQAVECPFHRPGHPESASVLRRRTDGRYIFSCWSCEAGPYDVIDLWVALGRAPDVGEAITDLADLVGARRFPGVNPAAQSW